MDNDAHEVSSSQTDGDDWAGRGFTSRWTDLPGESSYILAEPEQDVLFWHIAGLLGPLS